MQILDEANDPSISNRSLYREYRSNFVAIESKEREILSQRNSYETDPWIRAKQLGEVPQESSVRTTPFDYWMSNADGGNRQRWSSPQERLVLNLYTLYIRAQVTPREGHRRRIHGHQILADVPRWTYIWKTRRNCLSYKRYIEGWASLWDIWEWLHRVIGQA